MVLGTLIEIVFRSDSDRDLCDDRVSVTSKVCDADVLKVFWEKDPVTPSVAVVDIAVDTDGVSARERVDVTSWE